MRGHVTNEFDVVGASADEIWAVYGDKNLPNYVSGLQPGLFELLEIVEGDGGVGIPGPREWKEKFTTIDDGRMVKQVQQIEGGFLGIGFTLHEITFEILPKDKDSCIIKSTVKVDIDSQSEANAAAITVDSMYGMARAITKLVLNNKAKQ
ncbi:hypothetical protein MKW94_005948 [Papaver nudicaule]|uniref:Bet v I/Major latex protein domain-containing protein n=1 Tax=Papaver nudicaule TaxID=74823 RepID=A0AA42B3E5_PAPNU|nr:hypothetical protein [Papaver nudicaule]